VCDTEVIVVKAPASAVTVECGGQPMVALDAEPPAGGSVDAAHDKGTLLGKRYADEELGIELLCTKGGKGSLSIDGTPLEVKGAKPLPSSD
jgi:hypothetical protein